MKARVIMVLLFLCCLAAGWEAYRLRLQISQMATKLERHRQDEPALTASQKTEAALADRLAVLDKAARPVVAQPGKTDESKKLDPEERKRVMIALGRGWLEQPSALIYAHLARSLGLSDTQVDQLRDLNAARHTAAIESLQQTHSQAAAVEAMVPVENQMRTLLGDSGFQQYLQQIQLAPAEAAVQQISQNMTGSAQPLTETQQDQLVQLLAGKPKSGPSLNLVRDNANVTVPDAALAQAASFLSTEQVQGLTQYQQESRAKAAVLKGVQTQFAALTKAAAAAKTPAAP